MNSGDLCELSGRTLLVVEDDDDIVDMLATLLGRYGVRLVRSRTVSDAVAYVEAGPNYREQPDQTCSRHLYMKTAGRPLRRWARRFLLVAIAANFSTIVGRLD